MFYHQPHGRPVICSKSCRISNKVLLDSTGHYIQYLEVNHNGKDTKKNACFCITESHCCIPETNTILQINYISMKNQLNNRIIYIVLCLIFASVLWIMYYYLFPISTLRVQKV